MDEVTVEELNDEQKPVKENKNFRESGYLFAKRAMDIVFGVLLFIVLSWLILICLAVKWFEGFHNPIYVSERTGKGGKRFKCFQIRTTCLRSDELKHMLVDAGLNEAEPPAFEMREDPRVTKVGKVYRKYGLQNLLQLLNVIAGQMSLTGVRPPRPEEAEAFTEEQKTVLSVKGGWLQPWQAKKSHDRLNFAERFALDAEYAANKGFLTDVKIFFAGAFNMLFKHTPDVL